MKTSILRHLCAFFVCVLVFSVTVIAAPGDLDTTFDLDGRTTASIGVYDYARAVAIQPDGKIVVAGHTDAASPATTSDLSLVRFNTDGSLDTTFGAGGKVRYVENAILRINSVLILPDGKILAVGIYSGHLGVYRFNANGSLDTTFGNLGRVAHVIGIQGAGNDAVLQPDGKIIIAGFVRFLFEAERFTVFRLNADGSLDTSFNSVGYTVLPGNGFYATTVALQSDGRIVAGGKDTPDSTGYWGRFSTTGILEGTGLVQTAVVIEDVAIQADGKLVFAGYDRLTGTGTVTALTRYNADGTLDVRFGNTGISLLDWGEGGFNSIGTSLLLEPDGRIILGGRAARTQNEFRLGVARFNSHGFLDIGFGNGGKVTTVNGQASDVARQADGKIVAVGFDEFQGGADYVAARFLGGPSNTVPNRALYDWDGDGRADIAVYRPSTAEWFIINSFNSTARIDVFGIANDVPSPADYDGDSRSDLAIVRNGFWWRQLSSTGTIVQYPFAITGIPRPGDYSGDGRADLVAYEAGLWKRRDFTVVQTSDVSLGTAGDKPVLGDFDGDLKVDPAVYRPSTGEWLYLASSAGGQQRAFRWGIASDIPAPADFDGDSKTDFAVFRPADGLWYVLNSSNGSFSVVHFGLSGDKPVPADYDGDGRADIAVFRPSTGIWYLLRSTAGFTAIQWGVATDIPIPGVYVP